MFKVLPLDSPSGKILSLWPKQWDAGMHHDSTSISKKERSLSKEGKSPVVQSQFFLNFLLLSTPYHARVWWNIGDPPSKPSVLYIYWPIVKSTVKERWKRTSCFEWNRYWNPMHTFSKRWWDDSHAILRYLLYNESATTRIECNFSGIREGRAKASVQFRYIWTHCEHSHSMRVTRNQAIFSRAGWPHLWEGRSRRRCNAVMWLWRRSERLIKLGNSWFSTKTI